MDPQLLSSLLGNNMGALSSFGYNVGGGGGEDMYGGIGSLLGGALGGPIGAGIGGLAGGLLGGRKKKKKLKKQQKKLRAEIEKQRNITRNIMGKGLSQQEALARLATEQQLGGFDTAQKAAQASANQAKRDVLSREQQTLGAASQALTNRGLGGTSRAANIQRGIASDTNRSMAGIDQGLADYFGQLAMGRAGVQAGGTQALAGLAGQRSNFDIEDAQFWLPQQLHRLGGIETQRYGGFGQGGLPGGGMGGFDLSSIFN